MIINSKTNKYFWLGAFFVFLLDQMTKILALNLLTYDQEIYINSFISFHLIFNEDTIFLNHTLPFGLDVTSFRIIWIILALLISIAIAWVIKQKNMFEGGWGIEFAKTGLFLILGSLWGNAFDRIFRKEGVIDFIRLNLFTNTTPIMNIADIILFWGEFCLIIAWIIVIFNLIKNKIRAM